MALNIVMFGKLINLATIWGMRQLDTNEMVHFKDMVEQATPIVAPTASIEAPKVDNKLIEDMLAAMKDGRKIDAIRAHRSLTGMGLKESKDVIEKYAVNYVSGIPVNN